MADTTPRVPLTRIAREWTRIGLTGFGGPPAHIELLRRLVVERERWLSPREFEDGVAACNLLPGPASTQLAIYCARRVGGPWGAVVGGLGFITPAVVLMLALSALFLAHHPPAWVRGAGAGAGAAVAAVAVRAGLSLAGPSWRRAVADRGRRVRWIAYAALGGAAAALVGPWLVLVLLGCGMVEVGLRTGARRGPGVVAPFLPAASASAGGIGALAWVAVKVGALSFGGGFVIVPLMQRNAVHTYHWMTATGFLSAVALGQVTPGPVVATVAAVGYAAHGLGGGVLAAVIAFTPSFLFVLLGGPQFDRLRSNSRAQAFLAGAGPAAIGAILGSAIPLASALIETWQFIVLGVAAVALLVARRGIVSTLLTAGVAGAIIGVAGGPLPH
ncbi:MAG TPA: chromate efflux transporter [Solirubrobacteraceae bacterium]|nr:chromate efflux transporter [Solirubrobacteraceae bacterium]